MKTRSAGIHFIFFLGILIVFLSFSFSFERQAGPQAKKVASGTFQVEFSGRGLSSLMKAGDIYPTDYVLSSNAIGDVFVTYRRTGEKEYRQLKDAELKQAGPERFVYRIYPPYQSFLSRVRISASTQARSLQVLTDSLPVVDSRSRAGGYLAFTGRKGTTEWVQYDFPEPATVSAAEVYWLDDSELNGPYKVPVGWRILYKNAAGDFVPVKNTSTYETAVDRFNRVSFKPVRTTAVRLEMQLQPTHSAGLYRWRLETDAEEKIRRAYEQQKRLVDRTIRVESVFEPRGEELLWTVSLENLTDMEIEVADLGLPLPFNTQYGWDKEVTYNLRVIRHFLVAGQGSFVFCQRTNAEPPYLLMIPVEGTGASGEAGGRGEASAVGGTGEGGRAGKAGTGIGQSGPGFEYFDDGGRGIFCPYVHSRLATEEARARGGRWRFASSSVVLKPRGRDGSRASYSFKFLWADKGYESVRDLLYREGKFDVQVVPGMVVPENLEAMVAIRTRNEIIGLEPEFPGETMIEEIRPARPSMASLKDKDRYVRQEAGIEKEAPVAEGLSGMPDSLTPAGEPELNQRNPGREGDGQRDNGSEIAGQSPPSSDLERQEKSSGKENPSLALFPASGPPAQKAGPAGPAGVSGPGGYRIFRIKFRRLGENLITVKCAGGLSMPLEFFVTEDLETLFKKRASFLARRQQHRDPSKWYYGVYSDWDMKNKVLRSADDRDGLQTWLVDACDDAGNARPAFVASKNVYFPDQEEVAGLDLYIKHYLWGGMQMTEDEPYPFAIYGIPNWKVNRESPDPGRNGRRHIWRIYDYPHIVLLYYRMYQVARLYPGIKAELTAEEYLRRAFRTAIAYFTVPLEVEGWSAYGTPTMNEIVMNDLIEALEREGWKKEAAELRHHWEKKVLHFINDEPYLFGSEFAFDSTGFEATGAMARYALKRLEETGGKGEAVPGTRKDAVSEKVSKRASEEANDKGSGAGGSAGAGKTVNETTDNLHKINNNPAGNPHPVRTESVAGARGLELARDGEQPGDAVADEGPGDAGASSSESVPAANDESFSGKTDRTRVEKFLEKQLRLNVSARGWLETAYYYLGSDYRAGGGLRYTLSYMSQMGGWSLLDYALWWAKDRQKMLDHLRLGYASYLSSWALLNSGRPETDYGYWYPGPENDGAAGGGFEPMAWARGWNGKWVPRGSWNYSAEEDVGYCGAVRAAATVVVEDPVFGLVALGGKLLDGQDEDSAEGAGSVEASSWSGGEAGPVRRAEARYDLEASSTTGTGECLARPAEKENNRVDIIKIRPVNDDSGSAASPAFAEKGQDDLIRVIPRDGLRVRFHYVGDERTRWHVELEKGRLARGKPVTMARDFSEIRLPVEAAGAGSVEVVVVISGLPGEYEARDAAGQRLDLQKLPGGVFRVAATSGEIHLRRK